MNKTIKMLIGITAGLALLLGPTAVYAGKNDKKSHNDKEVSNKTNKSSKVNVDETTKTDNSISDSFQDRSVTARDNNTCGLVQVGGCGRKASGGLLTDGGLINGGKGGVLNGSIKNLLNDLLVSIL